VNHSPDRVARPLAWTATCLAGLAVLCNPPFSPLHLVWPREPPQPWLSVLGIGFLVAPLAAILLGAFGGRRIFRASPSVRRWALLAVAANLFVTSMAFFAYGIGWHFWYTYTVA
jgi:hypothetical protein